MPALATGRVRYVGEPIAAVAAVSAEIAERAAAAIEVEFDPLPTVFEPEAALAARRADPAPGLGELHGSAGAGTRGQRREPCADPARRCRGGLRRLLQGLRAPFHARRSCIPATPSRAPRRRGGKATAHVTVWSNGQLPYEVQATLADILQLPVPHIRVLVPGVGGGFGGKLRIGVEHYRRAAGARDRAAGAHDRKLRGGTDRRPSAPGLADRAAHRCQP